MTSRTKLIFQLFAITALSIAIAFVSRNGFAWTNPASAPPSDAGAIKAISGNIGIGTAALDSNYRITTSGGGIKAENNNASQPTGYFSNTGGGAALITQGGNVGIGTASPSVGLKLDVEGKVGATEYCDNNGANCKTITATGGGRLAAIVF